MNDIITTCIFLAAGKGTRMQSALEVPKPLAPIHGEPLLCRTIRQFHEAGVDEMCVVTGHDADIVANAAHSVYPSVQIIHNAKYAEDKNIYSLLLALQNLPDARRVIVVEGDVVLADKAVPQLLRYVWSRENVWLSCGHFHKGQVGGILKADNQGRIEQIRYSDFTPDLDEWYKNLGVVFIAPKYMRTFREMLEAYAQRSLDCYYMTPWQDNLDVLPAMLCDVGADGGATFNTVAEYAVAQRIARVSALPPEDIHLVDIANLRHIEAYDPQRVLWLAEKITAEGFWSAPLAVSSEYFCVMDGQHRMEAALRLGLKRVPAVLIDYASVPVYSLRLDYIVSVPDIISRALSGRIYPYKTAKHILPEIPVSHIPLAELQ